MSDKKCGQCEHFLQFHGEKNGECCGLPPRVNAGGFTSPLPKIKVDRRACSLFVAIPIGQAPAEKKKKDPDTVGDAIKQKRESWK